jgi:asparagine synthetase B (glutamine-hydrolysing)
MLPREIVDRPKRGFGIPAGRWLRGALKEMLCDTLSSQRARQRGYFEQARVEELISQHLSGRENWQFQLWNLLVLELWHRGVVDEPADGFRAAPPEERRGAGPGSGHPGGAGLHGPET